MASPVVYNCSIEHNAIVVKSRSRDHELQVLWIRFRRTIRVPDNSTKAAVLPDLGYFPLFKTRDFADELSSLEALRSGVFFPMYQQEAMWVEFTADSPFMIKVYAGGVNVVSGEHHLETAGTKMRRRALAQKKNIQDYVVVPCQRRLDGLAVSPGIVRQFVAMPLGTGYSVRAQLTRQEILGGLQFEITPSMPKKRTSYPCIPSGSFRILVRKNTGRHICIECSPTDTIQSVMETIADREGIPPYEQRLLLNNRELSEGGTLESYDVTEESTLLLYIRPGRAGWPGPMGVAANGRIEQVIYEDEQDPSVWVPASTITIPVHILPTSLFRDVTGRELPPCSITPETYARAGVPFFPPPEGEETGAKPRVVGIDPDTINDPDHLVNPDGPLRDFRTLKDLRDELK